MAGMLDGKVAVVTGAGRGIGRATALVLAANGAKVVVNDVGAAVTGEGHDVGPAQQVVAEITQANGQGRAVANTDSVAEWDNAQKIVQTAIDNFGRIDMVVNNAGILRDRMFHYMSPEEWDAVIKVHLYGAFYVSRAAVTHFRKQESGCFVHITSTSGLIGSVGQTNYGAAKLGIAGLSRNIAMDMQRYHIRSNCIGPHAFSRMIETVPGQSEEQLQARAAKTRPDHIAQLIAFLGTDAAAGVSGQIFGVRGNEVYLLQPAAADPHHGPYRRLDAGNAVGAVAAGGAEGLHAAGAYARRVFLGSDLSPPRHGRALARPSTSNCGPRKNLRPRPWWAGGAPSVPVPPSVHGRGGGRPFRPNAFGPRRIQPGKRVPQRPRRECGLVPPQRLLGRVQFKRRHSQLAGQRRHVGRKRHGYRTDPRQLVYCRRGGGRIFLAEEKLPFPADRGTQVQESAGVQKSCCYHVHFLRVIAPRSPGAEYRAECRPRHAPDGRLRMAAGAMGPGAVGSRRRGIQASWDPGTAGSRCHG